METLFQIIQKPQFATRKTKKLYSMSESSYFLKKSQEIKNVIKSSKFIKRPKKVYV